MRALTRVLFATIFVACWVGNSAAACAGQEQQKIVSKAQPNIVIVIADDLAYDSLGCYGNRDVNTPNIDALCRDGLRFTGAYTSTAMCAPSRAQLYTGLFPVRSGAYPNHSRVRPGVRSLPHYLQELGYRVGLNGKRHFKPASAFPFEKVGGGQFNAAAIRRFINRDNGQPFCLVVASHSPHVPWRAGNASKYDPNQLRLAPTFVDTPQTRAALTRYYGEVTDLDREVGECMKIVDGGGFKENTIFIFTTEQGWQFPGGKWTCYEQGLRVGLIVRWPGVVAPAATCDALVHYVDIVPTLIEAAGGQHKADLDGRSLINLFNDPTADHRDVIYGVHTQLGAIGSPKTGYPVRSIRVGQYKYIMNLNNTVSYSNALTKNDKEGYWNSWLEKAQTDSAAARLVNRYLHRPADEFYDLNSDPFELENLAENSKYSSTISGMRDRLNAWMNQQGDHGLQTELEYQKSK